MNAELNSRERLVRHHGHAISCVVLMLLNLFAPLTAVGDVGCYHAPDLNCDEVVDGQDLSLVLGAWGGSDRAMDLDGSCTVDGGDLALILGNWGAIPEPPGLSSLEYQQQSARFCTSVDSIEATIDGSLEMNALSQVLSGSLTVTFQDDRFVTMLFGSGGMVMQSGDSKIAIEWNDLFYDPFVVFNGASVLPGVVIDDLENDILKYGMTPSSWSEQSRMLMAHSIVYETPAFQRNIVAVMNAGEAGGPGFWCKSAAIAAGAAITALATAGCAALTGACAVGTTVTFGGMAIPCSGLIGLCAGGVFAGAAAAYELALAAWGD